MRFSQIYGYPFREPRIFLIAYIYIIIFINILLYSKNGLDCEVPEVKWNTNSYIYIYLNIINIYLN